MLDTQWNWHHFCEMPTSEVEDYSDNHGYGKHWDRQLSRLVGLLLKTNRYADLVSLLYPNDDWVPPLEHRMLHTVRFLPNEHS